jgi:hypothetical protein
MRCWNAARSWRRWSRFVEAARDGRGQLVLVTGVLSGETT